MSGYCKSVVIEGHKRTKSSVQITTLYKKNRTKMKASDIKTIAEAMQKANPQKKLMIKVLSEAGYFQLKGYNQANDVILEDDKYIEGAENLKKGCIYKASFYLI